MKEKKSNQNPMNSVVNLRTILIALILGILFSVAPAIAQLSVPLTVHEALPNGVTGMDRISAPVTIGIPLAEDSGITNVTQLGLSGTTAGQFRALGWWPNGNIRWVLADFQTDLTAGQVKSTVSLTDGSGNFGGSNLATEGTTITVNTGAATFTIKKSNYNIFDTVVVGSTSLVSTGNIGGIEATDALDTVYSSINDASSTAVVEENGPVRCVIKSTGALKSAAGVRLMDYTVRMHFYKGKSQVKTVIKIRNASQSSVANVTFRTLNATVPLNLTGDKIVTLARATDTVSGPLTSEAHLYQGYYKPNSRPYYGQDGDCDAWKPPMPGTCVGSIFTPNPAFSGFESSIDGTVSNALGRNTQATQGYAGIADSASKGVTIAYKWMAFNWLAGITFDNSTVTAELFSSFGGSTPVDKLMWFGKHDSREVMWNFNKSPQDGKETLYATQYPVVARASLDHYKQTKAILGQSEYVTKAEQDSIYTTFGKTSWAPTLTNPAMDKYFREWPWALGGGENQIDFPLDDMVDFLRTGNGGLYLKSEQRTLFNEDTGVRHSDDFYLNVMASTSQVKQQTYTGKWIEDEHAHVLSMPFHYFVTGNEAIKEGFLGFGASMLRDQNAGVFKIPNTQYYRAFSRKFRNLALIYEFSCQTGDCNNDYRSPVEATMNFLLDSRENPADKNVRGRNMDRGYIYMEPSISTTNRLLHSFFHVQIGFEAIYQVLRVMKDTGWGYNRIAEAEDQLTGQARFFFDEFIDYVPSDTTYPYKFAYDYKVDLAPSVTSGNPYNASRAAQWLYSRTGNTRYLDVGAMSLLETGKYSGSSEVSEPQAQALMWTYLNKATVPTWQPLTINTNDNGGGSYTLSWTVPAGAQQLQIKYSSKPIVEWLGFDKVTCTYQYDPANYTAFFAANNIANNPNPAGPGTTQTITLSGLPAGQKFAMKVLIGTGGDSLPLPSPPVPTRLSAPRYLRIVR